MPNTVSFSGSTVTITLERPLKAGTKYHVKVDAGAVTDEAGNAFGGLPDDTTLSFTTKAAADTTPPTLESSVPANNATDVEAGTTITLTFSEEVKAGTGNITIGNGSDDVRAVSVAG